MATDLERLVVQLSADVKGYENALKRAGTQTDRQAKAIENRFRTMNKNIETSFGGAERSLKRLGAGLVAGLGVQQLTRMVREVAAAGDALGDLADQTGATVEAIQVLRYAAVQTGSSAEQMDTAIAKLAVNLGEAQKGSGDLKKMLDANGISLKDAAGEARSFDDIMRDIAELVKNAPNDFAALEIVTTAFGAKNDELVTTLREGESGLDAWGKKLQATARIMDRDGVDALSEIDAKWNKATASMEAALKRLVIATGPLIQTILDEVIVFAHTLGEIADTIDLIFKGKYAEAGELATHGRETESQKLQREIDEVKARRVALENNIALQQKMFPDEVPQKMLDQREKLIKEERDLVQEQRRVLELRKDLDLSVGRSSAKTTVIPAGGAGGKTAADLAAALIAEVEGGVLEQAKWDVNHWRMGFSSDTFTDLAGIKHEVQEGMTTTVADAWRDLNRRIAEAQTELMQQVGEDAYNRLTEGEKAALTSVLYHHGAEGMPSSVIAAAQAGQPGGVAASIEALPGFRERHLREASVAMGGDVKAYEELIALDEKAAEERKKADEKAAEERKKAAEDYQDIINVRQEALGITQTEIDLFGQGNQKLDEALILQEEMNRLKDLGLEKDAAAVAAAELYAKTQAAGNAKLVTLEESQDATIERLDAMRDLSSDVFGGIVSDLRAGASAGEIFANVLDKILSKLGDMAVNMLTDALFGAAGTAGTGLLGSLFGAPAIAGARAGGGPVMAGSSYMVGEQGPEIFTPSVGGSILPNSQTRMGGELRGVIGVQPSPLFITSVQMATGRMIAENNKRLPGYLADRQRRGI